MKSYDANGNALTRLGTQTIGWNQSNYPTSIVNGFETATFYYDGNNRRWKQVYLNYPTLETTLYVGGLLEKVTTGSTVDWRHYIKAGNQTIAVYSRKNTDTGSGTLHYLLEDHEGSLAKITNSTGTDATITYVGESFSAFGKRRNPTTWTGVPTSADLANINAVSREGYTGQDYIANLGLNHMNGRVQDAIIGRFLSPDPYISEPGNTQNYNRYSYVNNNPMSFTDPSGFVGCFGAIHGQCFGALVWGNPFLENAPADWESFLKEQSALDSWLFANPYSPANASKYSPIGPNAQASTITIPLVPDEVIVTAHRAHRDFYDMNSLSQSSASTFQSSILAGYMGKDATSITEALSPITLTGIKHSTRQSQNKTKCTNSAGGSSSSSNGAQQGSSTQPQGSPSSPSPGNNSSRQNNPNLRGNVNTGAKIGGVTLGALAFGVVIVNVVGFPEVEGGELLAAIAGEPFISSAFLGAAGGGGAGVGIGSVTGYAITAPMPPPCH